MVFVLKILSSMTQWLIKFFGKKKVTTFLNLITRNQRFFYVDKIYDFQEKSTITRLTLLLPGKGCEWAVKTGGCTMCAFGKRTQKIGKNFSPKELLALYKISIELTKHEQPLNLTIYNGGSFLNDNEIPFKTQLEICQKVKGHPAIKKLFIESRVEFITEQKIKALKDKLGDKTLIIGIGLEAEDDKIRNVFIKKGLNKTDYEKAIKLLKENGVRVLTYIFLKPIYLTEKEAIEEAIKTIEYAFKTGTNEVALEVAFIQKGTLMAKLFKKSKYKLPWLWSIIDVIKKTYNLGPVYIGGFSDEPSPIAISSNCSLCSSKIKNLLQRYRETNNIHLFTSINCQCYTEWKREVEV